VPRSVFALDGHIDADEVGLQLSRLSLASSNQPQYREEIVNGSAVRTNRPISATGTPLKCQGGICPAATASCRQQSCS
jgi:hypothetical protein